MVVPPQVPELKLVADATYARCDARDGLKAYERIDPDVNVRKICGHYPFQRAKDKQRLIEALRRADVRPA